MSALPEDRERVLEENLRALFARAYRPVEIREGFEGEVRARATAALRRPAANLLGRAVFAAAASFAIAMFAVFAWERSGAARERILARGDVAVREAAGPWSRWGPEQGPLAPRARPLDVAVPAGRHADLLSGAGTVSLLGPARARLQPQGAEVALAPPAAARARAFQGRLAGAFGRLECEAADVVLALEVGGRLRARLSAGAAAFTSPDGRRTELAPGLDYDSASAAQGGAAGAAVAVAPPAGSGDRRPISAQDPAAVPGAAPALTVLVRDAEGRPIPRFAVLLLPERELPDPGDLVAHPCEDETGRFERTQPFEGATTVYVQAEGFALWTREHLRPSSEPLVLEVVLERGFSAAGKVTDAATGSGIAGAIVVSEADFPGSLLPFDVEACRHNPAAVARTDAEGRFRLEHLAARPTVLRAARAGYAPGWSATFAPDAEGSAPRVALSRGGALAGRVEREDGSPWAGVGVIAMPQSALLQLRRSYGLGIADAAGEYRIEDLPPGDFVAVRLDFQAIVAGAESRTEVREAQVAAGETGVANFLAPPRGSRFAGRALRADKTPLARTTVSIIRVEALSGSGGEIPDSWRSQTSSADGSFEFTDVAPGSYTVYFGVRSPMDVVYVDLVEIARDANVSRDVFAPAGELSGSVRSADLPGGIPNAVVFLEREAGAGECRFAGKLFTDDAGRWRAPFLADGSYRVRVYAGRGLAFAGRDRVAVSALRAVAPLDFELAPGAELELSVAGAGGLPLAGVDVLLVDERGLEFQPVEDSFTDSRGSLRLAGLPAGRVRVLLTVPGGARMEREVVAVAGEKLVLQVALAAGGK